MLWGSYDWGRAAEAEGPILPRNFCISSTASAETTASDITRANFKLKPQIKLINEGTPFE